MRLSASVNGWHEKAAAGLSQQRRGRSDERKHSSQNHGVRSRCKRDGQKALASCPNPEWTESEMRSIDEWIALQDMKLDRPEAIRRLVELVLKAKAK